MMDWKEIKEIPLTIHDYPQPDESELRQLQTNEVQLRLAISGFQLRTDDNVPVLLPKYSYIKSFYYAPEQGRIPIFRHINMLSTLLAFCYDEPKNHAFRIIMASDGTSFPLPVIYQSYNSELSVFLQNKQVDEIKKDWEGKMNDFLFAASYFLDHEQEVSPFLWYGRSILSNSNVSRYLDAYRCLERLSLSYADSIIRAIRDQCWEALGINCKPANIKEYFERIMLPRRENIPFFLESHGISAAQAKLWKEYRDRLTHGELDLEFNDAFRDELVKICAFCRKELRECFSHKQERIDNE